MSLPATILAAMGRLADPGGRATAARSLAQAVGCDNALVFLRDAEARAMLPAPGFPQTLAEHARWRAFLAECVARGRGLAELIDPDDAARKTATGVADGDAAVLVVLGPRPVATEALDALAAALPLLAAALRGEWTARVAAANAEVARASATEARALATALDAARREAHAALVQAEAANRAKDEFLAMVSHELRTPLNAVLGWARMLRGGALRSEQHGAALATIERNAQLQVRLIEDLLDIARITSGKLRLHVEPIDLAPVVEAAIEAVRPTLAAKDIRLQPVLDAHAGPVLGDSARIQQVVWNLLANAGKFTPRGGRVQVRLRRVGSYAEISVADTGRGIDPAFLPFVFERFRQEDASTTRAHGGLGLGLAITRHLVELHGGTIEAHSAGLGRGATFIVRLPLSPVSAPPERAEPGLDLAELTRELACPPGLAGLSVLVVDDEADARALLQAVLTACKARVRVAASAAEAREAFAREVPDVLVSDIGMSDEDGYSLIRALRALPPERGGRTPAVALTAYARPHDRARALLSGFDMHVSKPIEPAELLVVVANLTRRLGQT